MTGIVLLLTSLALIGGAAVWRWRRRRDVFPRCPLDANDGGEVVLPWSPDSERVAGAGAFYAYQMAASRIERGG